jgi:multisubunit Na+/H+ antiporter MnhG subunit
MLDILFALLGGIAIVLLPWFFLRFAAEEDNHGLVIAVAVISFFALAGSFYLAFSFWLFAIFPIFLLSSFVTFFLIRSSASEPDFVVEGNLLDSSVSEDLRLKLEKEIENKKKNNFPEE